MKKVFYIIAAAALLSGLAGCGQKVDEGIIIADLRYKVEDSYELDAISPKAFTIEVKSSQPWTITSENPEWCKIEQEEGEAVADTLVHKGQGASTFVNVQYYDNNGLDDRIDYINIASVNNNGKRVKVYQKGIAYLNIPEEEMNIMLEKAATTAEFHVYSNQKWSAKVLSKDDRGNPVNWLTIAEQTGENDGIVKVSAPNNPGEKRYAIVAVYDRHDEERALIKYTQDGVQLDIEVLEVKAGFDQPSTSIEVVSNSRWVVEDDGGDWYTVVNPDNVGSCDLTINFTQNTTPALRKGKLHIKTIPVEAGDAVAERDIVLKQGYKIDPVRVVFDADILSEWSSDKGVDPTLVDGGLMFTGTGESSDNPYARIHNSGMKFGTYTFRWSNLTGSPRVRHWFCYSDGQEMKVDIRPVKGYIQFDFNEGGGSKAPDVSSSYTLSDFSQPLEITYKFDPSGSEYCHVTYLVNGTEMISFNTSKSIMHNVRWGSSISMYLGVCADGAAGSAVLEWYDFIEAIDWGD